MKSLSIYVKFKASLPEKLRKGFEEFLAKRPDIKERLTDLTRNRLYEEINEEDIYSDLTQEYLDNALNEYQKFLSKGLRRANETYAAADDSIPSKPKYSALGDHVTYSAAADNGGYSVFRSAGLESEARRKEDLARLGFSLDDVTDNSDYVSQGAAASAGNSGYSVFRAPRDQENESNYQEAVPSGNPVMHLNDEYGETPPAVGMGLFHNSKESKQWQKKG